MRLEKIDPKILFYFGLINSLDIICPVLRRILQNPYALPNGFYEKNEGAIDFARLQRDYENMEEYSLSQQKYIEQLK
jgi:hypothetical protein